MATVDPPPAQPPPPAIAPALPRKVIPLALVIDPTPAGEPLVKSYCIQVIHALQALHPNNQLLVTCVAPSSHAVPLNPFLPPAAFLAALPSFTRRPARPASTLWRSTTGLLRAIRIARRRLIEGALAGAGGEGRGQLPKYVVVISGTDIENVGGDDVWFEDDDQNEPWESFAKSFARGQHCTTLFSLISLGHTPHLEGFWKECSGRFPANLIYTSLTPPPNVAFTFPLVSPSHACFLLGFYNNNRPQPPPGVNTPAAAASPVGNSTTTKRSTPSEPNVPNKKAKPNPIAPNSAATGKPKPTRTPSNAAGQLPQAIKPSPATASGQHDNVQQYLNDVKTNGGRTSQQSMNGAFATGSQGTPRSGSVARSTATPSSAAQQGQQQPVSSTPATGQPLGPPTQPYQHQGGPLPQIPPEMRAKVEAHLESIRTRVQRGQMTQEQAAMQIRQLQELTNQQRLRIAQQQAALAAAAGNGTSSATAANPPPANVPPLASPALGGQNALQSAPQRMDSLTGHRPVWKGQISWAWNAGTTGTRTEYTMYCQATPMQQSAVTELTGVKFQQAWRILSLVQIRMSSLQKLAQEHTLPALSLTPLSSETLPKELRDRQRAVPGVESNEGLFRMFSESMETRQNCGIVRFSGSKNGLVMVPAPQSSKLIALVFLKIPLPDAWLRTDSEASQTSPSQQSRATPTQHLLPIPTPPAGASTTGMFSSPNMQPFNLPIASPSLATVSPSAPPPPSFAVTSAPGGLGLQQVSSSSFPTQPFSMQPPPTSSITPASIPPPSASQPYPLLPQQNPPAMPMPMSMPIQAQAPPPATFPSEGIAGMDFSELQRLLGPEQFAQIMSGV
ncbi:hypothetical protein JCM10908_001525 [Rhodotorula pacifica]|uniref:uncharacterized protein n=1 Tax=Rhodotorula pacifica TaxID=1495444 RepID=UPI003170D58E